MIAFLDFGHMGFPFYHLGGKDEPADERAAYLRTYMPEAYASGLRFAVPLTGNEGYYIWLDSLSSGASVGDVVKPITDFINEYGPEIYKNTLISPDESLITVNGFVPYNGDTIESSYANESKVAIAYTYKDDSLRAYLHIINHNWDTVTHTMIPQDSIPVTIPVRDTCYSVMIISPDFPDTVYPAFDYEDGVVTLVVPTLEYYDVIILNFVDSAGISEKTAKLPDEVLVCAYPNPFNSSVTITVPAGARVEIYDLQGRLVYISPHPLTPSLQGEGEPLYPLPAGEGGLPKASRVRENKYIWSPNRSVPSGVYLIRAITLDGRVAERKIVLIR